MIKFKHLPVTNMDIKKINSPFGMRIHPITKVRKLHEGIDYPAPSGTPVHAVVDGKVTVSKMQDNRKGYGNYILIDHGDYDTIYAHLSARKVSAGQTVKAGDIIGLVGSTGDSTGAHLHFGLCGAFNKRDWMDPLPYLKTIGGRDMTVDEAKKIVKEKAGLDDKSVDYLASDYKYGKELIIKLAQAMN